MVVVDTNVLVYAADASAPEHRRCRALVEQWRRSRGAWFLTWGICYEFLRVVTHPRVLRRPWPMAEAAGFVAALLESPSVTLLVPTDRHHAVLGEIVATVPGLAGNVVHDMHTAVLMREHGIRQICTRDTDFHRFPFLEPVDPLTLET
ncbi:MAG: TA system VapC family ribonuclease toxin [Vicinamibacterales bacterium]